jgi:hypothetical protein
MKRIGAVMGIVMFVVMISSNGFGAPAQPIVIQKSAIKTGNVGAQQAVQPVKPGAGDGIFLKLPFKVNKDIVFKALSMEQIVSANDKKLMGMKFGTISRDFNFISEAVSIFLGCPLQQCQGIGAGGSTVTKEAMKKSDIAELRNPASAEYKKFLSAQFYLGDVHYECEKILAILEKYPSGNPSVAEYVKAMKDVDEYAVQMKQVFEKLYADSAQALTDGGLSDSWCTLSSASGTGWNDLPNDMKGLSEDFAKLAQSFSQ